MRYYRLGKNPHEHGTWVEVENAEEVDDMRLKQALTEQAAAETFGKMAVHVTARADNTHLLTYHVPRCPLVLPTDRS